MTEHNKDLYYSIHHYVGAWRQPDSNHIAEIKELLGTPDCPSYFSPPVEGILVYRGLTEVDAPALKKILNIDKLDKLPPNGSVEFSGDVRPRSGATVMSFTKEKLVATSYFGGRMKNGKYSALFVASTSDNPGIFIDMSKFYETSKFLRDNYGDEEEVLALGPVKLTRIEWSTGG